MTLTQIDRLRKLQRLHHLMQFVWDCGVPGCDGKPGHMTKWGIKHPFPHARANQLQPAGDWRAWLLCTGRGYGKTRAATEWTKTRGMEFNGPKKQNHIAVIAPDFTVIKHVCMEGESGLLSVIPEDWVSSYNKTTAELVLTNGCHFHPFSTNNQLDAEKVRGFQFHTMWYEEPGTQRYGETAWDIAQFSLRLGNDPRIVVTGTPRNTPLMRRLLKTEPGVTITRGSTLDNADNLSSQTVEYLKQRYEGTTLGRQELDGELLEVMPGALWDIDMIDVDRLPTPDSFERIVVAVDPAGSHRVDSDETGIVVVGLVKEHFYVLADYSGTYTPDQWAKQVIAAYNEHKADRVVAERNYGGDMVESTLRAADRSVSYRSVTATRGKLLRAEPIVALYEQHRVHHPEPGFPLLEDQMTSWVPPGQFETDERTGAQVALEPSRWSPDRVDALVWGVHELSQRRTRYSHG